MILVDSSVWVDFFNGSEKRAVHVLEDFIEAEEELRLSDIIVTEVLQGFKKNADFESASRHLRLFPIYSLQGLDSYIEAAQIYRKCRRRGITIRKTIDCMIAQTAIENGLTLLHDDADFDRIASIFPLKILLLQ